MQRPSPRRVFDNPQEAWAYLTQQSDDGFEGQHFDRKEVGRSETGTVISKSTLDGTREHVVKTVSAFANTNAEGGLLVLGISSSGDVFGVDHHTEEQRNSLTGLNTLLRVHAAEVKYYDCLDAQGKPRTICLICSAWVPNAICETPEATPKAWVRHGPQS